MRKKKNRFLLFCCSCIPGAGEMYLGFMKMGLSLLCIFALSIAVTAFTNLGILAFVPIVIWIYGFFHANNLGSLSDEEFAQMEDEYLFGIGETEINSIKSSLFGKYKKGFAFVLILLGIVMLWQAVDDAVYWYFGGDLYYTYFSRISGAISAIGPRLVIGIAIIWFGIYLVKGKKTELDRLEKKDENTGKSNLIETDENAGKSE